jgi:hypothetical protein
MNEKKSERGDVVLYTTPDGQQVKALVAYGWSDKCVNLYYLPPGEGAPELRTSVTHKSLVPGASGSFWSHLGE